MTAASARAAAVVATEAESTALDSCDVCKHLIAKHDAVATRYCDATLHNALARGCLCR